MESRLTSNTGCLKWKTLRERQHDLIGMTLVVRRLIGLVRFLLLLSNLHAQCGHRDQHALWRHEQKNR